MALQSKMLKLGENPNGILGKISGTIMNLCHKSIYLWAIGKLDNKPYGRILDVGCGGGKALETFCKNVYGSTVYGIDHSKEMVEMARKTNKLYIRKNRVNIEQASVLKMPYMENYFDLVTAFETIQFWPDVLNGLQEIKRVLKPQGQLIIVNRFRDMDSEWNKKLKLKSIDDYKAALSEAGFSQITWDTQTKKGWIMLSAVKLLGEINE